MAFGGATLIPKLWSAGLERSIHERNHLAGRGQVKVDLLICGGGLGGCAAALAALRHGLRVALTEPTDWLGGQLTQQGVPPDEHRWIEQFGCTKSYRELRDGIRAYYKRFYPVSERQRGNELFNPGNGSVSRICCESRVGVAVIESFFAPYLSTGNLRLLLEHKPVAVEAEGDSVRRSILLNTRTGHRMIVEAAFVIDATELGDLAPLSGAEFVMGAEARRDTQELHAAESANPDNQQAVTHCFVLQHTPGGEHVIDKPDNYNFWRDFIPELDPQWPGRLLDFTYTHPSTLKPRELGFALEGSPGHAGALNLWIYRRILDRRNFADGFYAGDLSLINWPQNDYFLRPLVSEGDAGEDARALREARTLSLSLLYWLQTEAPRDDGRAGYPELRLCPEIMGTPDGLAKYPYIRESRRLKTLYRIVEADCGRENRALVTGKKGRELRSASYFDSVGIGSYHIDLHPSTGGDNYIDFPSLPFEIPLGALIPERVENLIAGGKTIGSTHVTNGCYRLHPVEWNVGEAAGLLAVFALKKGRIPREVREREAELNEFQELLVNEGIPLKWPEEVWG